MTAHLEDTLRDLRQVCDRLAHLLTELQTTLRAHHDELPDWPDAGSWDETREVIER